MGRHWLRERGDTTAACGVPRGERYTIDMGAVTCRECQAAIQTAIESLRVPRLATVTGERAQSGACSA